MRTAIVFNFLVESTLIGSTLILLMVIFRPLLRRGIGSRVLWCAWLLVAMRLLIPLALPNPAMNALKPTLSLDAGIRPMADQVRTRVEDSALSLYWKTFGQSAVASPFQSMLWRLVYTTGNGKFSYLAMVIYGLGLILSSAWMLLQNIGFRSLLSRGHTGGLTAEEQAAYEAMCQRRHLRPLPVWRVKRLSSSCYFGLIHPTIAVPWDVPQDLLFSMLLRETLHGHNRDHLWGVVRDLCCAVHWFNPLVWLAARLSRVDSEFCCDYLACMSMSDRERRVYAKLLLGASEVRHLSPPTAVIASCVTMRGHHLKQRIRRVLHFAPPRRGAAVVFAAVCAVIALGMFCTDVQASTANLPVLSSDSLSLAGQAIETQQDAESYARAFMSLSGVEAEADDRPAYISKTDEGWEVVLYPLGSLNACFITFTDNGALTSYINSDISTDHLHPLAVPITSDTEEGAQWCAFLTEFIERNLPQMWAEFEAMTIVSAGRLDGEQFITIHLLDDAYQPLWQAIIQVAPIGRILSLTRLDS